jgi:hypothetical protein
VLPVYRYEGLEPLLATLTEKVIAPAEGPSLTSPAVSHNFRTLGNLLRDPNWLLGSGFYRSRCWLGYHNRIGNRLRNIDGFRAGLMSTNHARPPWSSRQDCLSNSLRYF